MAPTAVTRGRVANSAPKATAMVVSTIAQELDEQHAERGPGDPVGEAGHEVQLDRGERRDDQQDHAPIDAVQGQHHRVGGIEAEDDGGESEGSRPTPSSTLRMRTTRRVWQVPMAASTRRSMAAARRYPPPPADASPNSNLGT